VVVRTAFSGRERGLGRMILIVRGHINSKPDKYVAR